MKKYKNLLIVLAVLFILSGCESITPFNNAEANMKNTIGSAIGSNHTSEDAQKIYSKCAGCHGEKGEKSALGKSQIIGGEDKDALLYLLKEYRAGRLDQYGMGKLMKGQVAELTDIELEQVAEYIHKLSGQ